MAVSFPISPDRLPADFAAALGHCVAGFGFMEEALKRAIFALSRDNLGDEPTEKQIQAWIQRMEDIADDSLGTLIDSFLAACKRCGGHPDHDPLRVELARLREARNLLCHASWKNVPDSDDWHPAFINTKGEVFPTAMGVADLNQIHADTLTACARIVRVMRETGKPGYWIGVDKGNV